MANRAITEHVDGRQRTGLGVCVDTVIKLLERRMDEAWLRGDRDEAEELFSRAQRLIKNFAGGETCDVFS